MEHQQSPAKRQSDAEARTYGPEELAAMAAQLRALPPADLSKRRTNKQGAIRYLADEIAALQARGYTMEEVTDRLKGFGLDITTPTLKSYLQRAKDDGVKRSKVRRRRGAVDREVARDTQAMAAADKPGPASSEAPEGVTPPRAPDARPDVTSQSRSLHPENASTVASQPATVDTTTKAPAAIASSRAAGRCSRDTSPRGVGTARRSTSGATEGDQNLEARTSLPTEGARRDLTPIASGKVAVQVGAALLTGS